MFKFALLSLLICSSLSASKKDFSDKVSGWFDNLNVRSNLTTGSYIHSGIGTHFLGGNGVISSEVDRTYPVHIGLPTFEAGCGGISFTMGALSIASKDEFVSALKNIASNGGTYAFVLATQSLSPQIMSAMSNVQHWANQVNSMNVNSCEFAQTAMKGAYAGLKRGNQFACSQFQSSGTQQDGSIEARKSCSGKQQSSFLKELKQKTPEILVGDYNVAWEVLKKSPNLDDRTKQLFLNFVGTVVVKNTAHHDPKEEKDEKKPEIYFYSPKTKETLEVLLHGGILKDAYKISDSDGLNITKEEIIISTESSWKNKILRNLESIQTKLFEEGEGNHPVLDKEEQKVLQMAKFPIGSYISIMSQWSGDASKFVSPEECSTIIASEQLYDFMSKIINQVMNQAHALKNLQCDEKSLNDYINQLREAQSIIRELESKNFQEMTKKHQMINFLMQIDQMQREKSREV